MPKLRSARRPSGESSRRPAPRTTIRARCSSAGAPEHAAALRLAGEGADARGGARPLGTAPSAYDLEGANVLVYADRRRDSERGGREDLELAAQKAGRSRVRALRLLGRRASQRPVRPRHGRDRRRPGQPLPVEVIAERIAARAGDGSHHLAARVRSPRSCRRRDRPALLAAERRPRRRDLHSRRGLPGADPEPDQDGAPHRHRPRRAARPRARVRGSLRRRRRARFSDGRTPPGRAACRASAGPSRAASPTAPRLRSVRRPHVLRCGRHEDDRALRPVPVTAFPRMERKNATRRS